MTNAATQEAPAAPKHPLFSGPTKMIWSFREIKELWETVPVVEFRLGLLHIGFGVPHGPEDKGIGERISFYLDVADGYSGLSNGPLHNVPIDFLIGAHSDSDVFNRARSTEVILQQIAFKAFQMVVQRFFKAAREEGRSNKWANAHWLAAPGVVEKLIWFFRVNGFFGIDNLSYSGDEDARRVVALAKNFMAELCRASFEDWTNRGSRDDGALPALSKALIPWRAKLLEIFLAMQESPGFLMHSDYHSRVDNACKDVLIRAMKSKSHAFPDGREYRVPKTIAEGCFIGSAAAQVLAVLGISEKEGVRLKELAAARRQHEEAGGRLRRLGGSNSKTKAK